MQSKLCHKCEIIKVFSCFSKDKNTSDSLQSCCKECYNLYYQKHKETILKKHYDRYYQDHDKTLEDKKKVRQRDSDKIVNQRKKFHTLHPKRIMLSNARDRARKYGVPFDLVEKDIIIPEVCPILGIPLDKLDSGRSASSPSLDRISPESGYVKNNIAVVSDKANRLKNNGTAQEHRLIADWMLSPGSSLVYEIRKDLAKNIGQLVRAARKRAKKQGIVCVITSSDLSTPELCPILGIPIQSDLKKTGDNSPSIDRKNPTLGYVPENVFLVSWRANRIKNDGTAEEHRKIADWMDSWPTQPSEKWTTRKHESF